MPAKIAAPSITASDGHIIAAQFAMGEARKQAQLPKRIRSEESPFFARRGLTAAETTHRAAAAQARISSALTGEATAAAAVNGVDDARDDDVWTPGFHKAMQEMKLAPLRAASCQCLKGETSSPAGSDKVDVDEIRAAVEDAVEEAVEVQVAEALGPLRLIVKDLSNVGNVLEQLGNSLEQANSATSRENEDFHEQNDVLSRQIDLHYRDIAQHSEMSRAQLRAQAQLVESQSNMVNTQSNMISSQTMLADAHRKIADANVQFEKSAKENLETTCNLVGALSQIIANLPSSIDKAIQESLDKAYNETMTKVTEPVIGDIAAGHQKSREAFQASLASRHNSMDRHRTSTVEEFLKYEGKHLSLKLGSGELSEDAGLQKERRKRFGSVGAMWRRMTR
ncbi:hypothetical protein GQ602_006701 [Ophiocordyceps camponoti-floridani]|uniref:Uncharacterized protein n=1 Tax=Ophiocordyceps camponoti-floridani TaxID=2030778 RepID=A0A8H4VB97_9HYPO|nr:hypothetical protein GQ602_006701 [Ophiocordyceps camponoti-floridani]